MAKIEHVDYLAIPKYASEMEECGILINKELTENVYKKVEEMHLYWTGIRYNNLVNIFNAMIPELNNMLSLFVTDIPYALRTVANNYSRVDRGENATNENGRNPQSIVAIPVKNDVGMSFHTAEVETKQQEISNSFKNIVAQMDQMEDIYKKIDWASEAAENFKEKFLSTKSNIVNEFEKTNTQFKELMAKALDDNQRAENANTLK